VFLSRPTRAIPGNVSGQKQPRAFAVGGGGDAEGAAARLGLGMGAARWAVPARRLQWHGGLGGSENRCDRHPVLAVSRSKQYRCATPQPVSSSRAENVCQTALK